MFGYTVFIPCPIRSSNRMLNNPVRADIRFLDLVCKLQIHEYQVSLLLRRNKYSTVHINYSWTSVTVLQCSGSGPVVDVALSAGAATGEKKVRALMWRSVCGAGGQRFWTHWSPWCSLLSSPVVDCCVHQCDSSGRLVGEWQADKTHQLRGPESWLDDWGWLSSCRENYCSDWGWLVSGGEAADCLPFMCFPRIQCGSLEDSNICD